MTNRSPVAQAVLDAYGHYSGGTGCILDYELRGVAAALRAAANHLPDPQMAHMLYAIADELEGGTAP